MLGMGILVVAILVLILMISMKPRVEVHQNVPDETIEEIPLPTPMSGNGETTREPSRVVRTRRRERSTSDKDGGEPAAG